MTQQLAQLKARYKHVPERILVAPSVLLRDRNIALDDAKAQAQMHGVRITAASVNAARTLLSRMDAGCSPQRRAQRWAQDPDRPDAATRFGTRALDAPA